MSKTVLVTGGTGALGAGVVQSFLDQDWKVVLTWIVDAEQERIPDDKRVRAIKADLFDEKAVKAAVAEAAGDADAPLSAVVNLVGGFDAPGRVGEASIDSFEKQLKLNLRPTYLVTQAALPALIDSSGAVVCVSARAALQPFSGASGYIAAKAAVLAFVQSVAVEYRDDGVRCNAVLPSVIDTPSNRASQPDADYSRWVPPAEIGRVIRFLCSPDSAPTSGAAVPVYGRA